MEQHTTRKTKQETDERERWDHTDWERKWTRVAEHNSGQQLLLAHSGLSVPASQSSSYICQVCLSLCLTAGLQRVLFKIRPLLLLAPLQIKAHSEGDSSAHRTPLGNGWDRRINAFVEAESRARQSKKQRVRGTKPEWGGVCINAHTCTHNLRQRDTSSIGGPEGTYSTFVQCIL